MKLPKIVAEYADGLGACLRVETERQPVVDELLGHPDRKARPFGQPASDLGGLPRQRRRDFGEVTVWAPVLPEALDRPIASVNGSRHAKRVPGWRCKVMLHRMSLTSPTGERGR